MENIIREVEHSLAVESLQMTAVQKENLRCVGRNEITFGGLIERYVEEARKLTPDSSFQSVDCRCDPDDPYVYEGTDILMNKFGLKDFDALSALECAITGVSIAKLEAEPIGGNYELEHLKTIHKAIFGELYGWAGQTRQRGYLSKGESLFCAAEYIEPYAAKLFAKLRSENLLRGLERDAFAKRMAFYASEIDALHPFREGNGRTQRAFINQLARQAGWELNLWSVEPSVLLEAFIVSMSDESQLAALLASSISKR